MKVAGNMNKLKKLKDNQIIRYIFCGGFTTAVNVVLFYLLRELMGFSLFWSNFVSIGMAILFAFIVNKVIVFESRGQGKKQISKEFLLFLSMRLVSMAIEMTGVWFAIKVLLFPDIYGKLALQAFVIACNFFFSKYIVFKKGSVSNKPVQE